MDLSFTSTEAVFRDAAGRVSQNPNELVGANPAINLAGVCSVLQLGAIVPPWSPGVEIERLMPRGLLDAPTELAQKPVVDLDISSNMLVERIDAVLAPIEKPVLLFSGGMDSGLLAARLAALGRDDAVLFHFSFGKCDAETRQAEAMARHFGLKLEICESSELDQLACLEEPGRIYPMPFADESTAAMFGLAGVVVERFGGEGVTVIDGTGADGAFGMGAKVRRWMKILKIPKAVRKMLGTPYGVGAWLRRGRLEYWPRLMERSCSISPLAACIAQNPLAGVLYSQDHSGEVCRTLDKWVRDEAGDDLMRGMVVADLGLTCANIFAQKGAPVLRGAGLTIAYPFLSDAVVELGLAVLEKDFSLMPKEILRMALKRQAPAELVDRQKSGFTDPAQSVFLSDGFLEILDAAMDDSAPIGDLLVKSNVARACRALRSGHLLAKQTMNCLWAIAFTDRWYRTARGL